jgi:hypothetical protein
MPGPPARVALLARAVAQNKGVLGTMAQPLFGTKNTTPSENKNSNEHGVLQLRHVDFDE